MRFQARDGRILQALHMYDGVLARRHIKEMFWPTATSMRAVHERLSKLYHNRYIGWPNREQRNTKPGPKSICWLGWRGVTWVAGQAGVKVEEPASEGENQMRRLENRLRKRGIRWVREPRWSQLEHDLAVVDFRLAVEKEVSERPLLTLERWVNESTFRVDTDVVEYTFKSRDGRLIRQRRGVIPDGYFVLINEERHRRGDPEHKARLLLELDMATHARTRFAREKLLAGAAYVESSTYKARFGFNAGHWLVVSTGEVRMKHLIEEAKEILGQKASLFFFTTLDQIRSGSVLTAPIWWWIGWDTPQPLFPE